MEGTDGEPRGAGWARRSASDPIFLGRSREIEELRTALDEAAAGRGHLVLVAGEPGIGKTRLAEEFTREALRSGAVVLWARCREGEGAPPYWSPSHPESVRTLRRRRRKCFSAHSRPEEVPGPCRPHPLGAPQN